MIIGIITTKEDKMEGNKRFKNWQPPIFDERNMKSKIKMIL